jgi:hypothetical protein
VIQQNGWYESVVELNGPYDSLAWKVEPDVAATWFTTCGMASVVS